MAVNFEQVHNYYERLVFEEVLNRSSAFPAFTAEMLADVACLAVISCRAAARSFTFPKAEL